MTPTDSGEQVLENEWRIRVAIVGFSAVLLAAVVASIHLATLKLTFGTLLFAPEQVQRHGPNALRITALNPQNFETVPITKGRLRLVGDKIAVTEREFSGAVADIELQIAHDAPDELIAQIDVETSVGRETFEQTLRVVDKPATMPARILSHREVLAPRGRPALRRPWLLRLYPRTGSIVLGLENRFQASLTNEGNPQALTVRLQSEGVLGQSDNNGMLSFGLQGQIRPAGHHFAFHEVNRDGEQRKALGDIRLYLRNEARQLVVSSDAGFFIKPKQLVSFEIETLPIREELFADFWLGDTLVAAQRVKLGVSPLRHHVRVPENFEGLARLDVYRRLLTPEAASSSLVFWVSELDVNNAAIRALEVLDKLPGGDWALDQARFAESGSHKTALTELVLTRVKADIIGTPLLRSTLEPRQRELEERRRTLRAGLHRIFVATFILAGVVVFLVVTRHRRRLKRSLRDALCDEIQSGEAVDQAVVRDIGKLGQRIELLFVVAGLTFAGVSILVLLRNLR